MTVFLALLGIVFARVISETLIVNIANKGGDVLQERFEANSTEDVLWLYLQQFDGTLISQFIHFPSATQIIRAVILPHRDIGERGNAIFCFLWPVESGEYISTDDMSKLRQKNPHTIRRAEDHLPNQFLTMIPLSFSIPASLMLHFASLCGASKTRIFQSKSMIISAEVPSNLDRDISTSILEADQPRCNSSVFSGKKEGSPCLCSFSLCIVWYPCGLKYCESRSSSGESVQYRCGIRTCRKCREFQFAVEKRTECPVDFYV